MGFTSLALIQGLAHMICDVETLRSTRVGQVHDIDEQVQNLVPLESQNTFLLHKDSGKWFTFIFHWCAYSCDNDVQWNFC
jgi:hypothetical protein